MSNQSHKRDKAVSNNLAYLRPAALAKAIERGTSAQAELERRLLSDPEALDAFNDAQSRRLLAMCLGWWRRLHGISQSELARRTKTRQSAISEIEQGQADFRVSTLQRIARALGLVLEWRLSGDSWVVLYSWKRRAIEYDSAVGPVQIVNANGEDSAWVAMVRARIPQDTGIPQPLRDVTPAPVEDPSGHRYITHDDLDRISLSRMSVAIQPPTTAQSASDDC